MFEVRVQRPHPALLGVVRSFTQRRGQFVGLSVIKPLHARPDQFLEFYFRESYQVDHGAEGFQATPRAVLVGPTLSPGKRLGFAGDIETFTINFQPTGLGRLFALPMHETVDQAFALDEVLGGPARRLEAALNACPDFPSRVRVAQAWLADRLERSRPADDVDRAARLLARSGGRVDVERLAARSGLSPRQLQRRFLDDVGATPKRYGRLHRFASILEARRSNPALGWAELAAEHGYAD